jgi:hypothetical protein
MKKTIGQLIVVALLMIYAASAHANTFVIVDAYNNSSSGGIGKATTLNLTTGQSFVVSANTTDLWNAGDLPRWSNANGLTKNLFATGSDDSGQPLGTQIGKLFPNWTQGTLSAPYGSLVGQIGSGDFFLIGTSYTGTALNSGILNLFYWDENNYDNTGEITANVNPIPTVPIPAAVWLFGTGMLGLLGLRRKISS